MLGSKARTRRVLRVVAVGFRVDDVWVPAARRGPSRRSPSQTRAASGASALEWLRKTFTTGSSPCRSKTGASAAPPDSPRLRRLDRPKRRGIGPPPAGVHCADRRRRGAEHRRADVGGPGVAGFGHRSPPATGDGPRASAGAACELAEPPALHAAVGEHRVALARPQRRERPHLPSLRRSRVGHAARLCEFGPETDLAAEPGRSAAALRFEAVRDFERD